MTGSCPIETSRLQLRPLVRADAEAFRQITDHPTIIEAVHFLSSPFTQEDAVRLIEGDGFDRDRFWGSWTIRPLVLCGVVGTHLRDDNEIEIGYWFSPEAQGHGYASEGVAAICDALEEAHPGRTIIAECLPGNLPSWRLLERVGFKTAGISGRRPGRAKLMLVGAGTLAT